MKWEYKTNAVEDDSIDELLFKRGQEGWELVSTSYRKVWSGDETNNKPGLLLIFKRPALLDQSL